MERDGRPRMFDEKGSLVLIDGREPTDEEKAALKGDHLDTALPLPHTEKQIDAIADGSVQKNEEVTYHGNADEA
jgi:hypothetical protein